MTLSVFSCQNTGAWDGKQAAVCLSYDDALESHLNTVIPLLDSYGIKATFYVPSSFPGFESNIPRWEAAANTGHELGNHSRFHPCNGALPGREWVNPDYDLSTYTVKRFMSELIDENKILSQIDHLEQRTFAYTCGDKDAGGVSFEAEVRSTFMGARGVEGRFETIASMDLHDIGSFVMNEVTGEDMIQLVDQAIQEQALVVFLFHGIGGDHSIDVDAGEHAKLIQYLDHRREDLWIAPLKEISTLVQNHRKSETE